ncbi:hypothetical protein Pelo_8223 [Pelomyxa schiedti]|nr:hypothetical protein Pelo_8223 [Pelomyxa schiedti]
MSDDDTAAAKMTSAHEEASPVTGEIPMVPVPEAVIARGELPEYDPSSKSLYHRELPRLHHSSRILKDTITEALGDIVRHTRETHHSVKNKMSYDDLLRGLMSEPERPLLVTPDGNPHFLPFDRVMISNVDLPEHNESWPPGRMLASTMRILFLTVVFSEEASLSKQAVNQARRCCKPPADQRGYSVGTKIGDYTKFQAVPLQAMRGISFYSKTQTDETALVMAKRPPGCCCLACYCCCCSKQWHYEEMPIVTEDFRVLKLSVIMPPWGYRTELDVHLCENVPLSAVRDFIAQIQTACPHLYSCPSSLKMHP